ncbi:MAG TPA: ABC transporter permease [Bacteroidia bacterium]|jgi:ABC-2 type transport system permease protein|nr:ABC transporter permease [Bacteroidia bacterium]
MGKIGLIIKREIMAKLRSKAFVVMTFLGPLLFAGFIMIMFYATKADKTEQNILVVDETQFFKDKLSGNDYISFTYSSKKLEDALTDLYKSDKSSILYIPNNLIDGAGGATKIFYKKTPGFAVQTYVKSQIEKIVYEYKLKANNIDPDIIHNAKQSVKLIMEKVNENGERAESLSDVASISGFLSGAFMFIFILIYGMMVFRSVMEEKTNRIVEIIISSVKPTQLMLGKILGIAILGILQFVTMSLLTIGLTTILSMTVLKDVQKDFTKFQKQQEQVFKNGATADLDNMDKMQDKLEAFDAIEKVRRLNFLEIGICFLFYFIGGYLFYSSLLAAIGSAVDTEADSQQFMMPIMLPLMAGYLIAVNMMMNPEGNLAIWGSMIPFTSPIVMMARIPNGVPLWQILASLGILYASFFGTVWLAGKIYRTGILMYGKKTSWREISKWIFYK